MRKTYEREFKIKVCQEIDSGKATITAVAQEYSISRPVVSRWLVEYQRHGQRAFSGKGNRLPGTAEVFALQKRVKQLEMENEILKKFEQFAKKKKP